MIIDLYRYSSQSKTTFGAVLINGKFQCYSIEDRHRDQKIKHETRIPKGVYSIKYREFGGHYSRYKNKYTSHKGMLQIMNVPNFKDILIHIGNDNGDTSGCLLLCNEVNNNKTDQGKGTRSTKAYLDFYFKVCEALDNNEDVAIQIHDLDKPF